MKDETRARRRDLLWGLPASLILHALIAALLVYGLPTPPRQPQEEQSVNVTLVPPPDQPKPKPAPTKAPKVEKPPEQRVEKPPSPEKQPRKPSPIEILKPVFQFGEKDMGPRKSLDGNSPQDSSPSPAKDADSKLPVMPKAEEQADSAKAGDNSATAAKDAEPGQQKQAPATREAAKAPAPLATADSDGEIELPTSAEAPQPRPAPTRRSAKAAKPGGASARSPGSTDAPTAASLAYSGLPGVRKLYSQGATGDAFATSSMVGVPRDERVATLCANELGRQLVDASYSPELLPKALLKAGTIVDAPDVAFSTTTGESYHIGFRCEIDTGATRVLSLTFRVGPVIPPSEWARYGLFGR